MASICLKIGIVDILEKKGSVGHPLIEKSEVIFVALWFLMFSIWIFIETYVTAQVVNNDEEYAFYREK